ncbi:WXG100 family type VII secretion target [Streptomyces qinzhouensis]|uniref:TIGR04197 family type VII secretion effector n=1 Tax=Streptomyces qinzhouensis TaxID=2599401 RepID=A0A5B8ILJ5_9ACTN|nr:WXG100 family type VII secretion target [Streptomyces qinzhouensis]QDY79432.1 TIGR04197 family type VII secretion effector [Streptomyces qinzhouensis]
MADYIVNDERLNQTAASTMNQYDTAIAQLQAIRTELTNLTSDGYNTPAAKADFLPFCEDFFRGYDSVVQGLQGISKYVKGVGDGFSQLDRDLGASLRG